ncbi:MAG: hypothetical protein Edafosvirus5_34 [Edafosvirus sp.]|uniref:R3H domain-containing protein n=1 Tax=Edafosvirus sp. TaxID=2487765 RepID=A0A3G4ZT90_9VIRU|nr:MAG: hypothetical protein Edafosvirus5_34 [Edafosvirus sp.]
MDNNINKMSDNKEIDIIISKELISFANNKDVNLIKIITESKNERKLVHQWAESNGYISRSDYRRSKISHIKCTHCYKWNCVDDTKLSNDYCFWKNLGVDPSVFDASPYDYCMTCKWCEENTYYDYDSDNLKWYYEASGVMIIMKKMEAYKHLGNFRRH